MKCNSWRGGLGILILLAGCSTATSNPPTEPKDISQGQGQLSPQPIAARPGFTNPVVPSSSAGMATVPVPGLIQPTNPQARIPDIEAGRSDPFALLSMPSVPIASVSQPAQQPSVPAVPRIAPASPNSVFLPQPQPLPTVALKPLPPLARPNSASLPLIPISALPATPIAPAPATSAAEAIEISGAMQIGNRWSIIVKEPDAPSSRHAQVGDYLANGRVMIKRVVAGAGSGVIVVLQQDGREISKPISGLNPSVARK